ncbi:MAG: type IV secretion system protein [Acidipropionibacterium jensenii]|uniref:type IV secretion system protein n=1 Tax=Acidipropionibacterium jensenii TaxID=1749 RepID=UPI0026470132|nr:type IV secretion system protein [Acidipropionibacterium jensenii]MDN5962357.1 type IV secretion system protein [Propionibacterium sp.]MDN6481246.1 type IV secretion system protein [Acidipropionibacterium jensenii]MDN6513742.1 type IV secretion system protein [Acidipropionibacterium jensenii]MDN6593019.1 type IV secretion system protein [Acidipropionibacterium jensenii]MDN6794720.1 type IV secretion system protein [Propionibacterium sp.]
MKDFLTFLLTDVAAGPNSGTVPKIFHLDSFVSGHQLADAVSAWNAAIGAMQTGIVRPTATIILAILFVIELGSISRRVEGDSQLGLQLLGMTFLKFAIVKVAFDSLNIILPAITATVADWAGKAGARVGTASGSGSLEHINEFVNYVDGKDFLTKGLVAVLVLLGWLVAKIPVFALIALLVTRFIKLELFTVAAPLPMSFIAHRETSNIAVGFLKNFGATALQLFFVVLIVPLFGTLSTWMLSAVAVGSSAGWSFILQLIGTLVLIGLVCFGLVRMATEVSKEVLGS